VGGAPRLLPNLRSVVTGCAAAIDDGRIAALPNVAGVVPGADPASVLRLLSIARGPVSLPVQQSGARALLRIQDGCDEHCTFCVTRLARGTTRSRTVEELVNEARALAAAHREIVVTGTHIGAYDHHGAGLGRLVEALIAEVPEVRFRLSSIEATEVDDTLRSLYASAPERLAPYLHAPLQSGSDRVLRRMGRSWYTATEYAESVIHIAASRPWFGLSADVIAGFPGETEDDHAATAALIDRLPFTSLHVFPYSERPGTAAPRLGGRVDPTTIHRRAAELRALGARKQALYANSRGGQHADVVALGVRRDAREGLTEDYLSVQVLDRSIPRGTRFPARLELSSSGLIATPLLQQS
jgi:threonylcarbamoyladenosine tRNA methylthiotransferase MtaB